MIDNVAGYGIDGQEIVLEESQPEQPTACSCWYCACYCSGSTEFAYEDEVTWVGSPTTMYGVQV